MKTPIKTIDEFVSDEDFATQVMERYVKEQERLSDIMDGIYFKTDCKYRDDNCDYISCEYCDKQEVL